jgi:hypothetical protein
MQALEQLVLQAKAAQSFTPEGVLEMPELEIRFQNAVTKQSLPSSMCEPVLEAFCKSSHWQENKDWELSHIYHFEVAGQRYRSETVYAGDELKRSTIQKTRLAHVDMTVAPTALLVCATDPSTQPALGVRVSLAAETPVDELLLPAFVLPTQVFIRHRRTFVFASHKDQPPTWVYTLTRRWAGKNLEEAHAAMDACPDPGIEIEIECCSPSYLQTKSATYLAQSVMCKIRDVLRLLGLDNSNYHLSFVDSEGR